MYVQLFVSCLVTKGRVVIQLFQLIRHDANSCTTLTALIVHDENENTINCILYTSNYCNYSNNIPDIFL